MAMRVPRRLRGDATDVLWRSRLHWWLLARDIGFAIMLAVAAGFTVGALAGRYIVVVAAVAAGVWLVFSGPHVIGWWYSRLVVTDRAIVCRPGARNRAAMQFAGEDIADVVVHRSLLGRLLGFATLEIREHLTDADGQFTDADGASPRAAAAESVWLPRVAAAEDVAATIVDQWLAET